MTSSKDTTTRIVAVVRRTVHEFLMYDPVAENGHFFTIGPDVEYRKLNFDAVAFSTFDDATGSLELLRLMQVKDPQTNQGLMLHQLPFERVAEIINELHFELLQSMTNARLTPNEGPSTIH